MPAYKWPKWPNQRTTGPTRGLQTERSFSMIQDFGQSSGAADLSQVSKMLGQLRARLHGGGGPQVGEVTCLAGVKKNPPLHAVLQPRHPGVHFLKTIEWSPSTQTRKMVTNRVFWRLMHFYTPLLLLLQPSVQWLSIVNFNNDAKPPPK